MTQDNNKKHIEELYRRYLRRTISRKEYERLFDLIQQDENRHLLQSVIDDTIPDNKSQSVQGWLQDDHPILASISAEEKVTRRSHLTLYRLSVAASILVLVFALIYTWNRVHAEWVVHTTGYQQTLNIDLPDGSTVLMNANSKLRWRKGFDQKSDRLVYFTGEGFFDVSHRDGQSFTVRTETVDVNVLGTEFNLETRRAFTNVFLKEGKVVLKAAQMKPVEMEPGDLVQIDEKKHEVHKIKDQKAESALSWKEGVFTFEELTGIQILEKMEDIYGKEFIIDDPGKLSDIIVVQGLPYTDWAFTREALELALGIEFKDSTANNIIVQIK